MRSLRDCGNARVVGRINGAAVTLTQGSIAASMITMVMGDEQGCQRKLVRIEKGNQRDRIARIDRNGMFSVMEYPDVIIFECRQ